MFGDTELVIIETTEALSELVDSLKSAPVIGIDTEGDSLHHYGERVCLVQLSDANKDYIVDPLKVGDMSRLGELTANPEQALVMHGGDYDVVSLKRDFGCQFAGIFDTMIAAQFLGMPRIGLADLIKRFFGHVIDKKYQRHDWSSRPLAAEHLDYARGDTHWLLALREVLILQLDRQARRDAHQEECDILALREWGGRGGSAANFMRVKRSNGLDEGQLRVLRAVWTYRDSRARERDKPPFKVMPDEVLVSLASSAPTSMEALKKVLRPGSSMVRRHGEALVEAVRAGLEDTEELPKREPRKQKKGGPPLQSRVGRAGGELIFNGLKAWRNQTVEKRSLAPVVIASNDLLKAIARAAPVSIEDLSEVTGIRRWQVQSFGQEIVDIVAGTQLPKPSTGTRKRRRRRRGRGGAGEGTAPSEATETQGE